MSKKVLNTGAVLNELKGQSAFFNQPKYPTPPKRKPKKKQPQTHRVTESVTNRLTDFEKYDVPDYRKLQRLELRLTWAQKEYLDRLEGLISRDMPEGERSDPNYKRITRNSIVRVLVEIMRRLNLSVDASTFKSEKDLARDLFNKLTNKLTELQTTRVSESQTPFDKPQQNKAE